MYDLRIKGGTVIDGTGDAAYTADVAVAEGRIVEVGRVSGPARQEIDADGLLVTPGFVDVHTHFDGQATWDPALAPSSYHGVTTIVMGNCGVGFAPLRPGGEAELIELMEGVEDIPGTTLAAGIDWRWETFGEYLDALDERQWMLDVAHPGAACCAARLCHGRARGHRAKPPPTTSRRWPTWRARVSVPARSGSRRRGCSRIAPANVATFLAPSPTRGNSARSAVCSASSVPVSSRSCLGVWTARSLPKRTPSST